MSWRDIMGAPPGTPGQNGHNGQNPPAAPSIGHIVHIGHATPPPCPRATVPAPLGAPCDVCGYEPKGGRYCREFCKPAFEREGAALRAREYGGHRFPHLAGWYEERAAILEYDGGMSRDDAEREALQAVAPELFEEEEDA